MARPHRSQEQFYNRNSKQATKRSKTNFKNMCLEYVDRQSFPPMGVNYRENGRFSLNKEAAVFNPCVDYFELNSCKDDSEMSSKKNKILQFGRYNPRLEDRLSRRPWKSRLGTVRDASGSSLVSCPEADIATISMLPAADSAAYSPGNSHYENQWHSIGQVYYEPCLYTNAQSSDSDVWTTDLSTSSLPTMSYFSKHEQVGNNKIEKMEYEESKLSDEDSKNAAKEFQNGTNSGMETVENCRENGVLFPNEAMTFNREQENYRKNPFHDGNDFEFQSYSGNKFRNNAESKRPIFQNLSPFDPKFPPLKRSRKGDRRGEMINLSSDTFTTSQQHHRRNDGFNYSPNYPENPWNSNVFRFRRASDKSFPLNGNSFSYSNETFLQSEPPLDVNNGRLYQKRQYRKKNRKPWNDFSMDSCDNSYKDNFSLGENFPPSNLGRRWSKRNLYSGSIKRKKNYRWGSNVAPELGYKAFNEKWKTRGFNVMKRFNPTDNIQWRERDKSSFNYSSRGKRLISPDVNCNNYNDILQPSSVQIPNGKNFDLLYNNDLYLFPHSTNSFILENQSKDPYNDSFNNHQNSPFPKTNKFRRKMFPVRSEFRWRQKLPTRNLKATTFRNKNPLLKIAGNHQDLDWSNFNTKPECKDETSVVSLKNRDQYFPWNREPRARKSLLLPSDEKSLSRASHIPSPWVSFEALSPFDLLLSTKNQFLSLPLDRSLSDSLSTVDVPARLLCAENMPAFVHTGAVLTNSLPLAPPLNNKAQLRAKLTSVRLLLPYPVSPLRLGLCCLSTLEENCEDRDETLQLAESSSSAEPSLKIIQHAESPKP